MSTKDQRERLDPLWAALREHYENPLPLEMPAIIGGRLVNLRDLPPGDGQNS
ncbi:hypothetical protein SAMN06264364_14914 [Quadrisphaera granulorum]|uniref:Uncharacterized protein n=1 Tax=Quadrisphaera granulorum TaxID=317664 RepID=A0A315ZN41_9ACTN|nr:hypothetical protein [Quadrisphaera granulorum]PWJ46278.1 hypothetical protein BXY45_14914 [Quadrisphaera granulorum]SZE99093.1 hypothetical protein SAMN06264364_14914 [Quadrisphaera granulorum]